MHKCLLIIFGLALLGACRTDENNFIFLSKEGDIERINYSLNGKTQGTLNVSGQPSHSPTLSPNGNFVAYISQDMGDWDVHILELAGGNDTSITQGLGIEGFPAWSPDSKRLAYMSANNRTRDIFVCNRDGSNRIALTSDLAIDISPIWDPKQSDVLYFISVRNGYDGIYRKKLQEETIQEISATGGSNNNLKSVPGGTEVSYIRTDTSGSALLTYDTETDKTYYLLSSPGKIHSYAWSREGDMLALAIKRQLEVYDYNTSDGLKLRFIIEMGGYPAFAKSSDKLLFTKRVNENLQIFECGVNGQQEKQLTFGDFDQYAPLPY